MVVYRADEFVCDCTKRSRDAYCEEKEREENISQQAFFFFLCLLWETSLSQRIQILKVKWSKCKSVLEKVQSSTCCVLDAVSAL